MDAPMIARISTVRPLLYALTVSWQMLGIAQALDLTPREGIRQGNEGPPTKTLEFVDGKARFGYVPPAGWRFSGEGNVLTFFTPVPNASMKLMVVSKAPPRGQAETPPSNEDLQAWAAKFVPLGAEKVEFVKLVPGPFPMGGRQINEFIFRFELTGTPTSLSVSVVDFNDKERLLMLVSASAKNFEQVHQRAISSMFSWAPIE